MPRTVADIASFQVAPPPPTHDHPKADRRVRGDPERTTWNRWSDPTDRFHAGEWACEPGAWRIAVAEGQHEFCTLLAGRVRLTDEEGRSVEFGPGESFVLPGGFVGTWDTLEPLRKIYVLWTP